MIQYIKQQTDDGIDLIVGADCFVNRHYDEVTLRGVDTVEFKDPDGINWLIGKKEMCLMDGIIDDEHLYDNIDLCEVIQARQEYEADYYHDLMKERGM